MFAWENRVIGFDADALIYTAITGHPLGERVGQLLSEAQGSALCMGSTVLIPELLIKPTRLERHDELAALKVTLTYLQLVVPDEPVCELAVNLGAVYGLKMPDAVHLATAVYAGADTFVTNNRKDFRVSEVLELDIVYPEML
jgi:predicted nucleic acid-binding protein